MATRIRKKVKPEKTYDEVIKDICPKNIPSEWTYDMTSTLPKLLSAYLEKYLSCAEEIVILDEDVKNEILDLIISLEALSLDEWNNDAKEIFKKLGKILPYLWW